MSYIYCAYAKDLKVFGIGSVSVALCTAHRSLRVCVIFPMIPFTGSWSHPFQTLVH